MQLGYEDRRVVLPFLACLLSCAPHSGLGAASRRFFLQRAADDAIHALSLCEAWTLTRSRRLVPQPCGTPLRRNVQGIFLRRAQGLEPPRRTLHAACAVPHARRGVRSADPEAQRCDQNGADPGGFAPSVRRTNSAFRLRARSPAGGHGDREMAHMPCRTGAGDLESDNVAATSCEDLEKWFVLKTSARPRWTSHP